MYFEKLIRQCKRDYQMILDKKYPKTIENCWEDLRLPSSEADDVCFLTKNFK